MWSIILVWAGCDNYSLIQMILDTYSLSGFQADSDPATVTGRKFEDNNHHRRISIYAEWGRADMCTCSEFAFHLRTTGLIPHIVKHPIFCWCCCYHCRLRLSDQGQLIFFSSLESSYSQNNARVEVSNFAFYQNILWSPKGLNDQKTGLIPPLTKENCI